MAKILNDLSIANIDTIDLQNTWVAHDEDKAVDITTRSSVYDIIDKAYPRLADDGSKTGVTNLDLSKRAHRKVTLTGNITLTLSAPAAGTHVRLLFVQDATGGRTIDWSGVALANLPPVIDTDPNAPTIVELYYDGSEYLPVPGVKALRIGSIWHVRGETILKDYGDNSSTPAELGTELKALLAGTGPTTLTAGDKIIVGPGHINAEEMVCSTNDIELIFFGTTIKATKATVFPEVLDLAGNEIRMGGARFEIDAAVTDYTAVLAITGDDCTVSNCYIDGKGVTPTGAGHGYSVEATAARCKLNHCVGVDLKGQIITTAATDTTINGLNVNAVDIGVKQGTGLTAAEVTANTTVLNTYSALGYSIYFPPGDYEIDDKIDYPSTNNVKVWGDAARIYQTADDKRIFEFTEVVDLEVCGLHTVGKYASRGTLISHTNIETHIYAVRCENAHFHHNHLEGISAYALQAQGGRNVNIDSNMFTNGAFDLTFDNTGDINIKGDGTLRMENLIITNNQCNTNTLLGISSLNPAKNVICTGNQVVTKNASGVEQIAYAATLRKEGIQLQYHTNVAQGNDNADSSQYQMTITDNIVQGVRYACISCQSLTYFTENSGGIRGQISNNNLRYGGLETDMFASDYIQGGIIVNNCRELVISNNVVKDIENVPNGTGCAGIFVRHGSEETIEPATSASVKKTTIITGNIISDCRCHGIRLHDVGDCIITDNLLREVDLGGINQFGSTRTRSGKITISNNIVVCENTWGSNKVQLNQINSDLVFTGNRIESSGSVSAGNPYLLFIDFNTSLVRAIIANNSFVGNVTAARGVFMDIGSLTSPNIRHNQVTISSNSFKDLSYGYFLDGSPGSNLRGPIIHHNDTFNNVTNAVWNQQRRVIVSGYWYNESHDHANCVVYMEDSPQTLNVGNWIERDIAWNSRPSGGNPMGWYCTVSGQGSGSTWVAMPNL